VSLVSFPWPWEWDGEFPLFLMQSELLFVIIKKHVMLIGVLGHLLRKKR